MGWYEYMRYIFISVPHTQCSRLPCGNNFHNFPTTITYFSLKGKSTKMHTLLNPPILWQRESDKSSSANFLMHFTLFPPFTNHQYEIELVSLANAIQSWISSWNNLVKQSPVQDCWVSGAFRGGRRRVWRGGWWLWPKEACCWSWWSCRT